MNLICLNQCEREDSLLCLDKEDIFMPNLMANPCISHLNCQGVMEWSLLQLRGHEKCPHSTRL